MARPIHTTPGCQPKLADTAPVPLMTAGYHPIWAGMSLMHLMITVPIQISAEIIRMLHMTIEVDSSAEHLISQCSSQ